MIDLGKGRTLSTIILSTIAGHYGRGNPLYLFDSEYQQMMLALKDTRATILSKSSTRFKHVGNVNPWRPLTYFQYIQKIPNRGMVNAYGLTNPGVEKCASEIRKSIDKGFKVVPNFSPQFVLNGRERLAEAIKETLEAIKLYNELLGLYFWIVEINGSCPNSGEDLTKNMEHITRLLIAIRAHFPWLKVIIKLSYVHPVELFVDIEQRKLADVFHRFNTIPFNMVFSHSSNLKNGLGGASGQPITRLCFDKNAEISKRTNLPSIIGGGVPMDSEDKLKPYFEVLGAGSLSVCTEAAYIPLAVKSRILKHNT